MIRNSRNIEFSQFLEMRVIIRKFCDIGIFWKKKEKEGKKKEESRQGDVV